MKMDNQNFFTPLKKSCSICNSNFLNEIHDLRENKKLNLETISEQINAKADENQKISISGLSRHFNHYQEAITANTQQKKQIVLAEKTANKVMTYQLWCDQLIEQGFKKISQNFDYYFTELQDLERLSKIRYLLSQGETGIDDNLMGIFEKAAKKYGVSINQDSLFMKQPDDTESPPQGGLGGDKLSLQSPVPPQGAGGEGGGGDRK